MICSTIETCCLKRASMIEGNILDLCSKNIVVTNMQEIIGLFEYTI